MILSYMHMFAFLLTTVAIDKTTYICPKDDELQELLMERKKRSADPG
jgi:hypothetical protein